MTDSTQQFDVMVVGAGFAGLYALHKFRQQGLRVRVFEAGGDVGGTWFWNRYPGARCDVMSLEYSYQFSEALQQEWSWSEKYAAQPEILDYARHVADRFDLRRDIQFDTRVASLQWDDDHCLWTLTTDAGAHCRARFCVMATGCLSKPNMPDLPGLADFQGSVMHTARWPQEPVDFSGQRVAVIGTGSSAIQAIPLIARQAERLLVFQRTPNYSVPAHNAAMDRAEEQRIKAHYSEFRAANSQRYAALNNHPSQRSALEVGAAERKTVYEQRWADGGLPFLASFNDLGTSREANSTAADFVRGKIREAVTDPEVADSLCPDTVLGCKRLCVDSGYYQTFNRDNVTLVDVRAEPIRRVSATGLETGRHAYQFDCLILATGFDAMTGALLDMDIRGKAGVPLREAWSQGPLNYLGLCVHGFPNLFTITGPGSPSVLANMLVAIEQHVDWIGDLFDYLHDRQLARVEASERAQRQWVRRVNRIADQTLYPSGCNSWYTGANIPGKPRIFMPYLGYPSYVEQCQDVAASDYRGFSLS